MMLERRIDDLKATIDEAVALAAAAGQDEVRKLLELSICALTLNDAERLATEFRVLETQAGERSPSA